MRNILKSGGAIAFVLALGAAAGPARADTLDTTCVQGHCVRLRCDDAGRDCVPRSDDGDTRWALHRLQIIDSAYRPEAQPARYACDPYGGNCRWTRRYHVGAGGDATFDPAMNEYP